jgi:hypothetical protein
MHMPTPPSEGLRSRLCSADNLGAAGPANALGFLQPHGDRDRSTPSTPTLSHVGAYQNDIGYHPSQQNAFRSKPLLRGVLGYPFQSAFPTPAPPNCSSGLSGSNNHHMSSTDHDQDTVVRRQGLVLPSLRDLEAGGTGGAAVFAYAVSIKDDSNIPSLPRLTAPKPGLPRARSALTASFWSTVIGEADSCKGEDTRGRCELISDHVGISKDSAIPSGLDRSPSVFPPYHSANSQNDEDQVLKKVADAKENAFAVAHSTSLISDDRSKTGTQMNNLPIALPPMSPEHAYGTCASADKNNRPNASLSQSSIWTLHPIRKTQSAFVSELSCQTEDPRHRLDSGQPLLSSAQMLSGGNSDQHTKKSVTHHGTGVAHIKSCHILESAVTGLQKTRTESYAPAAIPSVGRGSFADESSIARQQSCIPDSHARLLLAAPSTPPAPFSSGYNQTTPTAAHVATPVSLTSSSTDGPRNESFPTREVSSALAASTAVTDVAFDQDRNNRTHEANINREIHVQLENLQCRNPNANSRNTRIVGWGKQCITGIVGGGIWNTEIGVLKKRQDGQGTKRSNLTLGFPDDEPNYKKIRMANNVDSKPFKCNRCDAKFDRVGHLQAHIRAVHHKEKPYPCPACSARFGHSSSLLRHKRTFKHDERVKTPRPTLEKPMPGAVAEPRRDFSSLYPQ